MKVLHVVQHTSAEYLGLMEDHLEGRGIRFKYYRPFTENKTLPHMDGMADGLVLLGGGPWGSAGERDVPTLKQEIRLAHACLMRDWPVVGIGLGAQILATAAGGKVKPRALSFEVVRARRVSDDALDGFLPPDFPMAIYMRDWPAPPDYANVLARDDAGRPLIWQIGTRGFGFVGHPGIKVAMIEDLIMEFEESPPDAARHLVQMRSLQRNIEDALVPMMTGLVKMAGWMDH